MLYTLVFAKKLFPLEARKQSLKWIAACAAACVFAFLPQAQSLDGLSAKGGKFPKFDKQNRLESLLSVQEAQRTDEFSRIKGLVWMGFVYSNAMRLTNLVIQAAECSIHNPSQTIYSEKDVKLALGGGDISLEGEGFFFSQTNTSVLISNQVRSVIKVPPRSRPPQGTPTPTNTSPLSPARYWVDSAQFHFSSKTRTAVYQNSVLLTDKQGLTLRTEQLTAELMTETNRLQTVHATTNLLVQFSANNQTNTLEGDLGVYKFSDDPANDVIEITRRPRWTLPGASGRGDVMRLYPRLSRFESHGNGFARLNDPREALAPDSDPSIKNDPAPQVSAPIELRFLEGIFEPGLIRVTNSVTAVQADRLKLACLDLRGFLDPTNHILRKLEANGQVQLQLNDKKESITARGQHLDYWLTGEQASKLQLRQDAEWSTKLYSGKGQMIWIDMARRMFEASNKASASIIFQASANTKPKASQRFGFGDEQVDITSARYGIRPGSADFDGAVQIVNPDWRLDCAQLRFKLHPVDNRIESVEALGNVIFERFEQKSSDPSKKADSPLPPKKTPNYMASIADSAAPWKLACQRLILRVASPANQIISIEASERVTLTQNNARATGDLLIYDASTELLKLTGTPVLKTEKMGEIRGAKNAVLVLDLTKDRLTTEGATDIVLPGGLFTSPEVKPRRIP